MATTPTYNWETPDDTDYVYQGAAAIRTLANSIDSTTASLGQGVKCYTINTTGNLTLTTGTETSFFTAPSFTPVVGRLYLISYSAGEIYKTGSQGDVYVALRKNNAAGTLLNRAAFYGLNQFTTAGMQGGRLGATFTATGTALTATAFVPCVTVQTTTNGVLAQNINSGLSGSITITDIGVA